MATSAAAKDSGETSSTTLLVEANPDPVEATLLLAVPTGAVPFTSAAGDEVHGREGAEADVVTGGDEDDEVVA